VHCSDLGFEAPNERGLTTQVVSTPLDFHSTLFITTTLASHVQCLFLEISHQRQDAVSPKYLDPFVLDAALVAAVISLRS
jgi:hypothetical protein